MKDLISTIQLVKAPETDDSLSVWTDYCELQCLVFDEQRIDQDQLCNIVLKSYDFSGFSEKRQKNKKDKLTIILRDVYSHVTLRKRVLGDRYPFSVNSDDQICIVSDEWSNIQKLYILLLCASNLCYMQSINHLTSDFEVISLLYMRNLFPSMTFKLFGSSNTNRLIGDEDIIKDGRLKDRIVRLSNFISVDCIDSTINRLSQNNFGDGGLDLVGIRQMGDERKSIPVIFGQCACSPEEWSAKQQSISESNWSRYIMTWETSFQKYIFIPIWNMNSDKQFEDDLKISHCVVVDRQRIMFLADDSFITKCSSL